MFVTPPKWQQLSEAQSHNKNTMQNKNGTVDTNKKPPFVHLNVCACSVLLTCLFFSLRNRTEKRKKNKITEQFSETPETKHPLRKHCGDLGGNRQRLKT